jgi:hypothetical protein
VTNKKERQTGGFFMRLKTDESLRAYALFSPDPEAEKNPGYYEYFEHFDKPNNTSVPCGGDDCYMCELGDSPSVRASTLWYFPDNPNGEKLKILKLNGYMIRDFAEIDAEEGGVLGRLFRVKRLSDDGKYRVSAQAAVKPLKKGEISELLKAAMAKTANEMKSGTMPMDLEAIALRQLKAALAKQEAVDSLTEDDDDDDEDEKDEKPKSRRGKPKEEVEDETDDDEDEDEDEDDSDESDDDDEDENDDEESDEDEDEDSNDDDEDEDENDDEDSDEEESESMEKSKFEVVSASEKDETITVKIDGKSTKLWVGEGVEPDWDIVKKGAEITVDAEQDEEGDWVITKLTTKKPKADGGKKSDKKKSGKKK